MYTKILIITFKVEALKLSGQCSALILKYSGSGLSLLIYKMGIREKNLLQKGTLWVNGCTFRR